MPIYEYCCRSCGEITEALRPAARADEAVKCDACGHEVTERVQSVFNAQAQVSTGAPTGPGCGCGNPHGPCSA